MTPIATPTVRDRVPKSCDEYVAWIDRLCAQPGARSALRRGLRRTPDQAITMHRYVAPWTESLKDPADEWAYYTVAALMADRPRATRRTSSTDDGQDDESAPAGEGSGATSSQEPAGVVRRLNLGETLAGLGGDPDRTDRTERRLHLLVRQQVPGIQRQLPGLIRYVAAARLAPDWGLLLHDLTRWRASRDTVCREWLQAYYRTRARNQASSEAEKNSSGE